MSARSTVVVAATALLVATAGALALIGRPPSDVVLALAAAFVPYAALGFVELPAAERSVRLAMLAALGAGAVLVVAPPTLSDDVFRYLWDARVLASGISPYAYAPDAPELAHLRDDGWLRVNNPELATIYPPLAQVVFFVANLAGHYPASVKLVCLLAHVATVPVVARMVAPAHRARAAFLLALNPLALAESALAGHVDVVAGTCLVAAAGSVALRPYRAGLLAAAAAGVKLAGLLLVPLLARRRVGAGLLTGAIGAACLWPLLTAGGGEGTAGVDHYARRWRGNEGIYAVVEVGATALLESWAADGEAPPGHVHLTGLRPLLEALDGTVLDPRAGALAEKKEVPDLTDFEIGYLAALLARSTVLALVLVLAVVLPRWVRDPVACARWVVLCALLLAPQVHPWYLLWLLPLEVASRQVAGLVWSAVVLVAYAPLSLWIETREWNESQWARALEHGLVLGVMVVEAAAGKIRRFHPVLVR